MSETIITILDRERGQGSDKKTLVLPSKRPEYIGRRRLGRPWEYTNTRTIHYQSYRVKVPGSPDYYFNGHDSWNTLFPLYVFVWVDPLQAQDGLYDPATITYDFAFDGTTYTWSVSGTPGGFGDTSGSTSFPSPSNPPPITGPGFNAAVNVVGSMSMGDHVFGTDTTIRPLWGNYTRTLVYHARRDVGESSGTWDDGGHPGVTVYGNNIQAETTFYGGAGFTNPVTGTPHPDDWTAQIATEATALIAALEAEPHIRNVTADAPTITFTGG